MDEVKTIFSKFITVLDLTGQINNWFVTFFPPEWLICLLISDLGGVQMIWKKCMHKHLDAEIQWLLKDWPGVKNTASNLIKSSYRYLSTCHCRNKLLVRGFAAVTISTLFNQSAQYYFWPFATFIYRDSERTGNNGREEGGTGSGNVTS